MKSFGHCNLAGVTDLQEGRSVWANWDLHLTVAPGCVQTGLCPLAGEAIDGIDCLVTVLTDEITDPATDDLISTGCRLAPDSETFELVLPQLGPQLDPGGHEAPGRLTFFPTDKPILMVELIGLVPPAITVQVLQPAVTGPMHYQDGLQTGRVPVLLTADFCKTDWVSTGVEPLLDRLEEDHGDSVLVSSLTVNASGLHWLFWTTVGSRLSLRGLEKGLFEFGTSNLKKTFKPDKNHFKLEKYPANAHNNVSQSKTTRANGKYPS